MAWCRQAQSNTPTTVTLLMAYISFTRPQHINVSHTGQNSRNFTDDIFRCIVFNEKYRIPIKISIKFVPQGPIKSNSPSV